MGKLRRPTKSAWLINVLARQASDDLSALLELGTALQDAQQRMAGDELRQLSVQRRKAVDALARRAVELGAESGYTAPDGAVQEVGQTLQTALGDPEIGERGLKRRTIPQRDRHRFLRRESVVDRRIRRHRRGALDPNAARRASPDRRVQCPAIRGLTAFKNTFLAMSRASKTTDEANPFPTTPFAQGHAASFVGPGWQFGYALDPKAGIVIGPPTLSGWHNVPMIDILGRQFGLPVRLENDANAAALGEWRFGAGRGTD